MSCPGQLKTQRMSENREIYTAGKNFTMPPALTGCTISTSASGLCIFPQSLSYELAPFFAEVCVVFCAFLLFLSHSVAFHFVGHIQGVFLTCLKTTLHQDSDIPMVIHHERLGEKIGKDHFGLWYLCL